MVSRSKDPISVDDLRDIFDKYSDKSHINETITINDARLYDKADSLVKRFKPNHRFGSDKRWLSFYLPIGSGKCMPIPIIYYDEKYYIGIPSIGSFILTKSDRNNYNSKTKGILLGKVNTLLDSISNFKYLTDEKELDKRVPYEFRTGKILRKDLVDRRSLMPADEANSIINRYRASKAKPIHEGITVNDYINTAFICYKVLFPEDSGKDPTEVYKSHADFRNAGLLDIDKSVKEAFNNWLNTDLSGSHPFEIVAGWSHQGILLYPPTDNKPYYILDAGAYIYFKDMVRVMNSLIDNNVPVKVPSLAKALKYLTGDEYVKVNELSDNYIRYDMIKGNKRAVSRIIWDRLEVLHKVK